MQSVFQYILDNLPQILTAVFTIGIVWKYVGKFLGVVKEVKELAEAVIIAMADKKLTKEEIEAIVKEAKDVPEAIKNLIKKDQ